ncbi:MAG: 1-deoxy-D-xylulose-5-phosphate reductoisomerase [Phycisphaeraceae bacterium]|nr:1-deoxy-D-xylulose-5-phosphate reductoisomerase [Phycisphaeraceae bacterium]
MSIPAAIPIRGERRIIILGATGSIGTQAVEVIEHLNALARRGESDVSFRVVGLAAGRNAEQVFSQAARLGVQRIALANGNGEARAPAGVEVLRGPDAAERLVRETDCDLVLAAMVGSAGLPATLAAVELGRAVALANKETLVAAGELVVAACGKSGTELLAVDSEHSALWQCLESCREQPCTLPPLAALPRGVSRLILTASGGPFRTWDARSTHEATPKQALRHPTWQMGPKVTIDSASLTNKALEVLEAHWLFGATAEQIGVVVHPQSIVHSLVEFADGSVLAQLGANDMRTPIQYALAHPARPAGVSRKLDLASVGTLEFVPLDRDKFPAIDLAYEVIARGGTAGAVFNAANEAAVEAFLARRIPFGRISALARDALREVGVSPLRALADVLAAEGEARRYVERIVGR